MKKENVNSREAGITLIALVITIIVLMILAGVTLNVTLSENGILKKAVQATIEYSHATVKEELAIENAEYILAKELGETNKSLIEYLEEEKIITKESEGKYKVEVTNLIGNSVTIGIGTDGKDVYMLEKSTEIAELGRIASKEVVKIAASSKNVTYNVAYYDEKGEKNIISKLSDKGVIDDTRKTITFTVDGKSYQTKEGTTWYEFCQEHPDEFICSDDEVLSLWGNKTLIQDVKISDVIIDGEGYNTWPKAECVARDSLILTKLNNETIFAKDISNGDSIVYYNFKTNKLEEGTVEKVYIHKDATNFVRYTFEDGSYLEATDYHPIYATEGWKSYTRRNGYEVPEVGDKVKTEEGYKILTKIEAYTGKEDCYDFAIIDKEGNRVDNYFANGTLVQSSL